VIAKLNAAIMIALADPTVRTRLADIGQEIPPRAADAGGASRAPKGRDREMVADHQGGRHQGAVNLYYVSRVRLRVKTRLFSAGMSPSTSNGHSPKQDHHPPRLPTALAGKRPAALR
jgi:hypothetical protein